MIDGHWLQTKDWTRSSGPGPVDQVQWTYHNFKSNATENSCIPDDGSQKLDLPSIKLKLEHNQEIIMVAMLGSIALVDEKWIHTKDWIDLTISN